MGFITISTALSMDSPVIIVVPISPIRIPPKIVRTIFSTGLIPTAGSEIRNVFLLPE